MKVDSYMLCTHLSCWTKPHFWAWLQAAWQHGPQPGLYPPSLGRELPLILHRSPVLLPGSATNPRETQPKLTTINIRHLLQKLHLWGRLLVHLKLGEKNLNCEAPSFRRHLKPQQGTLLWVKRKDYVLRDMSVYSSYNKTSLTKASAFLHQVHLIQRGYTRPTSISWQVSQKQCGEWLPQHE